MVNQYSVDLKLKIVKTILNEHVTKHEIERTNKDYPITLSMSRTATPTDNPVIESLNGWIKAELKHNLKIHDFIDINTELNYTLITSKIIDQHGN